MFNFQCLFIFIKIEADFNFEPGSGDLSTDIFGHDAESEPDLNNDGIHDEKDLEILEDLKKKASMQFCAGSCWEFDDENGNCYIPQDSENIHITCGGRNCKNIA